MADRLPNQTPENQVISIDSSIDATGMIDEETDLQWIITTPGVIENGTVANHVPVTGIDSETGVEVTFDAYIYPKGKVYGVVGYSDDILTNGGKISETKNFNFDSKNKNTGLFNIESEKALTYSSAEGAHLVGGESFTVDGAAEPKRSIGSIRCVFSSLDNQWLPPFCNIVTAKSNLININSAKISSHGQSRIVSSLDSTPAELNYVIAVTPDSNSWDDFAEGTIRTYYAGSVMEGRDEAMYYGNGTRAGWDIPNIAGFVVGDWFKTSKENSWKDITEVSGGIKKFQKTFTYKSGFII